MAAVTHFSDDATHRWLDDPVCVGVGQVEPRSVPDPADRFDLTLGVAELS